MLNGGPDAARSPHVSVARVGVMIAVRMAEIVSTAAVTYPKPGGVSQRLKRIMIWYSENARATLKAVVPQQHNHQAQDAATASLWLPRQDP
jgi:hypothetical protein